MSQQESAKGRTKRDFERNMHGLKLVTEVDEAGRYLDQRTRELYSCYKSGTENPPSKNTRSFLVMRMSGVEPGVPIFRTGETFTNDGKALARAQHMAKLERGQEFGIYKALTFVSNPEEQAAP